jgi:hypothetical protein
MNPMVNYEESIDKCFEQLSSAIQEVRAAAARKRQLRADPRPHLRFYRIDSGSIQDELRLKNWLRRHWKIMRDPTTKFQINDRGRSIRRNPWTVRTRRYGRSQRAWCEFLFHRPFETAGENCFFRLRESESLGG